MRRNVLVGQRVEQETTDDVDVAGPVGGHQLGETAALAGIVADGGFVVGTILVPSDQ